MIKILITAVILLFSFTVSIKALAHDATGKDSLFGTTRDRSFSVRHITDIRERFASKPKYFLDYIQNQFASVQSGNFLIDGFGQAGYLYAYRNDNAGFELASPSGNIGRLLATGNQFTIQPRDASDGKIYFTNTSGVAKAIINGDYTLDVNGTGRISGNFVTDGGYNWFKRAGSPGIWITDKNQTNNTFSMYVASAGVLKWALNTDGLSTTTDNLLQLTSTGVLISGSNIVAGGSLYAVNVPNESADPDRIAVWSGTGQIQLKYMTKSQLGIGTSTSGWSLGGNTSIDPSSQFIGTSDSHDLAFRTSNIERLRIDASGNLGINTSPYTGYKLAVNGDAIFTKIKVKTYSTWPDYVFHSSYKLPSLNELENYIKQNNHLPDVPSADSVERNGLDVGDNQAILLKKIEELTLYMIDLNKKVDELKEENKALKAKLENSNR